jgi:hypothetical protein
VREESKQSHALGMHPGHLTKLWAPRKRSNVIFRSSCIG